MRPRFVRWVCMVGGLSWLLLGLTLAAVRQQTAQSPWIVYTVNMGHYSALYRIRTDGSGQKQLVYYTSGHLLTTPVFNPQGLQLFYRYDSQPYLLDFKAHRQPERLPLEIGFSSLPAWSADGAWLYYSSGRDGQLYRYHLSSGQNERLTHTLHSAIEIMPHPDGEWLFFGCYAGGNFDLCRVNLADERQRIRRLVQHPAYDSQANLTRNGAWVVFVSERGGELNLHRVRPDGEDLQRLTNFTQDVNSPIWSPDGEWIAFLVGRGVRFHLYRIAATGQDLKALAADYWLQSQPRWSAEGGWLVFAATQGRGDHELYKIRPDGRGLTRLTNDPQQAEMYPTWSPIIDLPWAAVGHLLGALILLGAAFIPWPKAPSRPPTPNRQRSKRAAGPAAPSRR